MDATRMQEEMLVAVFCTLLVAGCATRPFSHPIQDAVVNGDLETIEALVATGADLDVEDNRGRTPLYYASWYGRPEITKYLLSKGADPAKGAAAKGYRNALHEAAYNGHVEVAEILIAHGMDVNCRTSAQHTPLHIAAWHRYPEMVRLLISKGADVDAQDRDKHTALTYYPSIIEKKNKEYKEVVEILLDAGADIDHVDGHGGTALLAACVLRSKEVVALLLKRGANPNLGDRDNLSPLDYAVQKGYIEIVDLLRQLLRAEL